MDISCWEDMARFTHLPLPAQSRNICRARQIYMEKPAADHPHSQQHKKKKNKWEVTADEPQSPVPQVQPSAAAFALPKQIEGLSLGQAQKMRLSPNTRGLTEMAKTYHIEMNAELGSGFASVVYLGENIHSHEIVCVKVTDYMAMGGQQARQILSRQIKYLNQFDCRHIVRLYDVYESASFCYLIMEYCPGGDLYQFLLKSEVLHPLFVRQLIQQICDGLLELKNKSLVHRDLKTENIFLGKNFQAKIGDLGFCVTTSEENIIDNVGSPIYMSPEVLRGGSHSFGSDIYGLAVIWYELLEKRAPWAATTEAELLDKKMHQPIEFQRPDVAEADKAFIQKCLSVEQQNRVPVEAILEYCIGTNPKEMQELKQLKEQEQEALRAEAFKVLTVEDAE